MICHSRRSLASALALSVLIVTPARVDAEPPPTTAEDALAQTIDAGQAVEVGPAELIGGHVDIGPRLDGDEWTLMVHDDGVVPSVWRSLDDAVIRVADTGLLPVPDDPNYSFLGVEPGTEVHVIPQVQNPDMVWVGWNTQEPNVMASIDRGVTLTLVRVDGPGDLVVFLQSGNLSAPDVLWQSTDLGPQPLWVEVNTHTHANWVFTEPGEYLVEVEAAADLIDGRRVTDIATMRFAVGDAADAAAARSAALPEPTVPVSAPAGTAGAPGTVADDVAADDDSGPSDEDSSLTIVVVVAAVALAAVVALVVMRGGRVRRRAEAERLAERAEGPER